MMMVGLIVIHYYLNMKTLRSTKVIGGKAQWCKHIAKKLKRELDSLGIIAVIECQYPTQNIMIFFKNRIDLNLHKLSGSDLYGDLGEMYYDNIEYFIDDDVVNGN